MIDLPVITNDPTASQILYPNFIPPKAAHDATEMTKGSVLHGSMILTDSRLHVLRCTAVSPSNFPSSSGLELIVCLLLACLRAILFKLIWVVNFLASAVSNTTNVS